MFGMNHREKNAQKGVQKQLLNGLKVLVLGSEKLCVFLQLFVCLCGLCISMKSCYGFGELVCISVVILHLSAKSLCLFSFYAPLCSHLITLHREQALTV